MEIFRGSQGKHFRCVVTRSLTLWMTSYERLGGYVKCSVRLRLKVCPLCRLRFSVVLNCRDCQQQGLCVLDVAEELQKAALMVLEYVKSYLRASCASHFPSCGL